MHVPVFLVLQAHVLAEVLLLVEGFAAEGAVRGLAVAVVFLVFGEEGAVVEDGVAFVAYVGDVRSFDVAFEAVEGRVDSGAVFAGVFEIGVRIQVGLELAVRREFFVA